MALAFGVAIILGAPRTQAAHSLRGFCLNLLLGLGDSMVMDVVVVNVLRRCLLAQEALASKEWASSHWGQLAPDREEGVVLLMVLMVVVVVRGAGTWAVAAHTRRLATRGLKDPRQVVVQDSLRVLFIAARG